MSSRHDEGGAAHVHCSSRAPPALRSRACHRLDADLRRRAFLGGSAANVAVAAKSAEPHKTLPGTIHTVVDELHEIAERNNTGAKALALQLDVRDAGAVEDAVHRVASHFRSLDMVVNNVRRCF